MNPTEPSLRDILKILSEIKIENQSLRTDLMAIQARLTPISSTGTTPSWGLPKKPELRNPVFPGTPTFGGNSIQVHPKTGQLRFKF